MTDYTIEKKQVELLFSTNNSIVLETLDRISEMGNRLYLPILIDVLQINNDIEIKEKVIKILSEVKHNDSVPELIKAIETEKYRDIRETLIRICWENGLDYTNHLSTFMEVLIQGEYMEAFEAFTVIENSEGHISEVSSKEYISMLKAALPNVSDERQTLIHRIIQFIPSLIRP